MSTILFLLTGRKQKKNRNDMKIAYHGEKGIEKKKLGQESRSKGITSNKNKTDYQHVFLSGGTQ